LYYYFIPTVTKHSNETPNRDTKFLFETISAICLNGIAQMLTIVKK